MTADTFDCSLRTLQQVTFGTYAPYVWPVTFCSWVHCTPWSFHTVRWQFEQAVRSVFLGGSSTQTFVSVARCSLYQSSSHPSVFKFHLLEASTLISLCCHGNSLSLRHCSGDCLMSSCKCNAVKCHQNHPWGSELPLAVVVWLGCEGNSGLLLCKSLTVSPKNTPATLALISHCTQDAHNHCTGAGGMTQC